MKVTIDNSGRFTLTAENKSDNAVLFSITNSEVSNVVYNYPQASTPKKKQSFIKRVFTSTEPVAEQHTDSPLTERVEIPVGKKRKPYVMSGKYTKKALEEKKRKTHSRNCPVEGCDKKLNGRGGVGIHMRMVHGVDQHGEIHETYIQPHGKGKQGVREVEVSQPVVELPNGKYKLQPQKQYLTVND